MLINIYYIKNSLVWRRYQVPLAIHECNKATEIWPFCNEITTIINLSWS